MNEVIVKPTTKEYSSNGPFLQIRVPPVKLKGPIGR